MSAERPSSPLKKPGATAGLSSSDINQERCTAGQASSGTQFSDDWLIQQAAKLDRLEVFFGDAHPAEARVYARLPRQADVTDCTFSGEVVGPTSVSARTLPASVPLTTKTAVDQDARDSLLAEAILPDPCFWTPAAPYLYDVHVRLLHGTETVAKIRRSLGIRRLGTRRRRLVLDGDTWVLRAARRDELPAHTALDDWHAAAAAMYVADPDERLCEEASKLGVLLVAGISEHVGDLAPTTERLSRSASVGVVAIAGDVDNESMQNARRCGRNLLFAWQPRSLDGAEMPDWADLVICPVDDVGRISQWAAECHLPMIAWRPAGPYESVSAARGACDRLQRDLAGRGDFAGYLV